MSREFAITTFDWDYTIGTRSFIHSWNSLLSNNDSDIQCSLCALGDSRHRDSGLKCLSVPVFQKARNCTSRSVGLVEHAISPVQNA